MVLYVARHGQTDWNAQQKVCGISDIALTETGWQQARQLADAAEGKSISRILTSPLSRALDTAHVVADRLGLEVQTDNRLMEQNYGIFEGADRNNPEFLAAKQQFASRFPQGESVLDVTVRVYDLLNQLKQMHLSQNLLIVTHGGVCRAICSYFLNLSNEEFFRFSQQNCQLEVYCLGE